MDRPVPVDVDVSLVADQMAQHGLSIQGMRTEALHCFQALGVRLQVISDHIRACQAPTLQQINLKVHFALIALIVSMMHWPDTSFPQGLFHGFPAVGFLPPCGIWAPQTVEFATLDQVLAKGKGEADELPAGLQDRELEVVHEAGVKDEAQHWCTAEFGHRELLARYLRFRLLRRFVIARTSGKKRVIDDASAGGQSYWSRDANRLQFCSALQPCAHLQALAQAAQVRGRQYLPFPVVTCGEDLPDAYRNIPMLAEHAVACIVAYKGAAGRPVFRQYHSMLFGLPLAVSAFNRLPFLCQAMLRRIFLMASFYYDDCALQDWQDVAVESQQVLRTVMSLVGFPFAEQVTFWV